MNDALLPGGLSPAEQEQLMAQLYALLGRQAAKYLSYDTSLPTETAEELLRSLVYTLRLAAAAQGGGPQMLLHGELEGWLRQGQQLLQTKLPAVKALWQQACLTAPQVENVYLQNTLRELGLFFRRYDPWYFAHQVPCSMDYPLALPVSEDWPGLSYVERWLERLLAENRFLGCFAAQDVARVLSASAADYRDYPLNLCEQPFLNAVGLAILKKPVFPLALSDGDCRELSSALFGVASLPAALHEGAARVCAQLGVPADASAYLQAIADSALPRLAAARPSGSVQGVFLPTAAR